MKIKPFHVSESDPETQMSKKRVMIKKMKKLTSLFLVSRLCLGGTFTVANSNSVVNEADLKEYPNIVYIFADQMRFSAMSCMQGIKGAEYDSANLETPNLDRLAHSGMLFANAFSTTPVSSPHRKGLLTGTYEHSTTCHLQPDEITLPMCLKEKNYRTGYIGKWHMLPPDAVRKAKEEGIDHYVYPEYRKGWDFWAGHNVSHNYFGTTEKRRAHYYLNDDKTAIYLKNGEYEPTIQTDMALEYIKQNKSHHFALFLSWGPPHNPYTPPESFDNIDPSSLKFNPNVPEEYHQAARKVLSKYYAQVESLDVEVGRILDELERLHIRENTIVIFSSDHGDMLYSHENCNEGKKPGLKRRPWDEAARIPGIISWPAKIKKGQRSDMLWGSVNYMPTILGFVGIKPPESVQGRDLSDIILGKKTDDEKAVFMEQLTPGNTAYLSAWRAVRTKEFLYAESGHKENGEWMLFDVKKDPFQMENLIENSAYNVQKLELKKMLHAWRSESGDGVDMRADYLKNIIHQREIVREQKSGKRQKSR